MENKFIYTIIIPHYKSVALLSRCLMSIPSRNDIQILVIDDNSNITPEEFYRVCPSHNNLRYYFLTENHGAGHARNVGLKHALGKWLIFADSDDFFINNAFNLCDKYKDSEFDIVYFGIRSVDSNTGIKTERYRIYNSYIDNYNINNNLSIDKLRFRHDVPWGKMIKRNIITENHILFDETQYCNDTMFSTISAMFAKKIFADKTPFYCVTSCDGSLTTHKSLDAYMTRYQVILRKNEFLRKHGYPQFQLSIIFYLIKFWHFGIPTFIKGIRLGIKHHANFFVGASQWRKKIVIRIKHKR